MRLTDVVSQVDHLAQTLCGQVLVEELQGLDATRKTVQIDLISLSLIASLETDEGSDMAHLLHSPSTLL